MTLNAKPLTPLLDAVEQEARERAEWQAGAQEREAAQRARAQAEATARAERVRVARERRDRCIQAVSDADQAAGALVAALDRYLGALPVAPHVVQARVASFLHKHFAGRFGPLQSNGDPALLADLRWEGQ